MFNFLFKKKDKTNRVQVLNEFYAELKKMYPVSEISEDRKNYLRGEVEKYGYLPYPHQKALEELSDAEVLYALEYKWKLNNTFSHGEFSFTEVSALSRNGIKNSDWIKKEGHDIKLVNLAGLGNGNKSENVGRFIDWMRQLLILPAGNSEKGIMNTTMYLIPFHPREFGCAYLPMATCVSKNLEDKEILEKTGKNADEQVKLFIEFAQLAGHPVIYDILPQTGRFSKFVLANPEMARWYDIPALIEEIKKNIDLVLPNLSEKFKEEDLKLVADIYKKNLKGGTGDLSEYYQNIYDELDSELVKTKKILSSKMLENKIQIKLHKKAQKIIKTVLGTKKNKLTEEDITKQGEVIQQLIKEGIWPAPGGAWCSAGVPVFDKMSDCGSFPTFLHYDFKGKDVSAFANLDCQTPYYFVCLENGKFNKDVIKKFIEYMENLQEQFNFDGFRVDHIDHVVDEVSEKDGVPISYRAPQKVLGELNRTMKSKVPYFATLAEYMLWDSFYKEYHQNMSFDLLWGNDIICQSDKTPECIIEDNNHLSAYNKSLSTKSYLSILKTYNNQDGEFREIDRYPAQLGEQGALFKWFKYKFLPGGKFAQRPVMYIDGDESFTKTGMEATIGNEVSMKREYNYDFYAKFDAINRFAKNNNIILKGEANIIREDEDGFVVWQINAEGQKQSLLVVANSRAPFEKFNVSENEKQYTEIREGHPVYDKHVQLPSDNLVIADYYFDGKDYVKNGWTEPQEQFDINELAPAEFRIYLIQK